MQVAKGANLALTFLLELGVLFAAGRWGFTLDAGAVLRILAGLGAPAALATLWGLFMAGGKAPFQFHGLARAVFEIVWFGIGAGALAASGLVTAGAVFYALYVINAVLRLVWHQV